MLINKDGSSTVMGNILSLLVILIIAGSIVSAFYIYVDSSSQQSMRIGFTDLGSQIARDITNIHIISVDSKDITLTMKRNIPLTMGGRGYSIRLKNTTKDNTIYVEITDGSFLNNRFETKLNSVDTNINVSGIVYSGSGEMNIRMTKNITGTWIWVR